jgi:serine/threonine-protein kinase
MEVQVLQWFERALAQKPEHRKLWLSDQDMEQGVRERVLRLLDADQASGAFLEETAIAEEALPPEFPKVGERLGAYELLKPLESGGMGVVYLGRRADDVYDQQVAIKLVRPVHLLAAAEFRRQLISRFEDERSILARMSHPNVARILDGGSTGAGIPYLVMEYVDGVPLTDYCKANKLDVRARLALFGKVCDGVQEAHRHLIVHRDLKPDNILVGENGEPRLLDFGIAKILEQEPLPTDGKRHTSLSAMTPAYASPEQVKQQALTTSSDVYSLGVMLYQLLAGVRPYELGGLRPSEAEAVVCDTLPDPMRKMLDKAALTDGERKARRAQITPDLERIVAKAMHKESARRYGSAQELADDIRRYLNGEPVLAHPDSTAYRMGKFVRRHRFGVAAASLALLAVLASAGVAIWQAQQARRAADDTVRVNNFLMDVLKSSDPYNTGSDISMSQAVDEAAARVTAGFPDRPDLASKIRFALGYSMISRNKLDTAERELGLALRESRTAFGPEAVPTLRIREGIAQLRKEQGRMDEAQQMLHDIVDSFEAQGLQSDPAYYVSLANLGEIHLSLDDLEKAELYLGRALALPPPAQDGQFAPTDRAVLKQNLAQVAHARGELVEADRLYLESIGELERVHPDGSPELATALSNLSTLRDEQGKADEAFALIRQSVEMREKAFPSGHPTLITHWALLSQRAVAEADGGYALTAARKAAGYAEDLLDPSEPLAIYAQYVLAEALLFQGGLVEAEQRLAGAEIQVEKMPPEAKNLRNLLSDLGQRLCQAPEAGSLRRCGG